MGTNGSWKSKEERDLRLNGVKTYSKKASRLTDESRQAAMELLVENIKENRDIAYFAEIFNGNALSNKMVATLMGLNVSTLSTQKFNIKKAGRKEVSIRTKFCYRALKHLKSEIIYFLMNDKYFDDNFELKREFKEAFNIIAKVNAISTADEK